MLGVASATIYSWFKRAKVGHAGWRRLPGRKSERLYFWGELVDAQTDTRVSGSLPKVC